MTLDDIEDLIRRYLSAGVAVVIILVPASPSNEVEPQGDPPVINVEPEEPTDDGEAGERDPSGSDPEPPPDPADETDERPDTDRPDDDADPGADPGADPDAELADLGPADGSDPDDHGSTPQNLLPDEWYDSEDSDDSDDSESDDSESDDSESDDSESDDSESDDSESDDSESESESESESDESEGTTAAEQHGWGEPDREDDFTDGLEQWDLYTGPGHDGQGERSPDAATVEDGVLVITGDSEGTTAGMAWHPGQRYGRWEGRVRAPVSDPSYNALLLLWPDAEDFPVGGEIDFMEMQDPTRQVTDLFLHHGPDNEQVNAEVEVDGTQWHNWAVEWTPDSITAYVDGEEWFRTTDTETFPPGPMHLCIQLDWFPDGAGEPEESRMEVAWVRQYSLDSSESDDPEPDDTEPDDPRSEPGPTDPDVEPEIPPDEDNPAGTYGLVEVVRRMFSWG